jgi:hypothetical protein
MPEGRLTKKQTVQRRPASAATALRHNAATPHRFKNPRFTTTGKLFGEFGATASYS